MIKREVEKKIKSLSKKYPVIAITGPRQSGKTTLARSIFSDYEYYNLENLDYFLLAKEDPKTFLGLGSGKKMIIDEIQKLPELFSYIQVEVDEQKIDGHFVITGSQQFGMSEKITQSLAGRVANFTLLPLSVKEMYDSEKLSSDVYTNMITGFYPRIHDKKISPKDYFNDYIFTYVERDIRQIKDIGNISSFKKFLKLTAGRVGQVVNLSSLSSDVGVNYKTIESWLSVLEASYIIFRLQPYFKNYGKRHIKSPKIYFYDTGLLCYLLGINKKSDLKNHFALGNIFENFIISETLKNFFNKRDNKNIYYWRTQEEKEVDLIIDNSVKQIGVEIKISKTFKEEFFDDLNYWYELNKKKSSETILVYNGDINKNFKKHKIYNWKNFLIS